MLIQITLYDDDGVRRKSELKLVDDRDSDRAFRDVRDAVLLLNANEVLEEDRGR